MCPAATSARFASRKGVIVGYQRWRTIPARGIQLPPDVPLPGV